MTFYQICLDIHFPFYTLSLGHFVNIIPKWFLLSLLVLAKADNFLRYWCVPAPTDKRGRISYPLQMRNAF
jgi:hypothetical protein